MITHIMTITVVALLAWLIGYRSAGKKFRIFETKKERIYVAAQVFVSTSSLAIFQTVNNSPETIKAWDVQEWKAVIFCALILVTGNTLLTWLAYMSDPKEKPPMPEPANQIEPPKP